MNERHRGGAPGKEVITFDEIDFAIDRLQVGMQKPSTQGFQNKDAVARKRQELVAWHEAGACRHGGLDSWHDGVAKVTIVPRTNGAGGFTLFTPPKTGWRADYRHSYKFLKSQLSVALGGASPKNWLWDGRTSRRARRTTCSRSATSRAA